MWVPYSVRCIAWRRPKSMTWWQNDCRPKDWYPARVCTRALCEANIECTIHVPVTPNHLGAAWRKHRKIIAQGFSESVVTGYVAMFNKHIGDLLADIEGRCGRGEFNLKLVANVFLMNTVLDTTLGHDVDEQDKHTYEKFFAEWVFSQSVTNML